MTYKPEDIKKLREAMGVSQADFADEMGVTVTTVSRWENGAAKPTGKLVLRTIEALWKRHMPPTA